MGNNIYYLDNARHASTISIVDTCEPIAEESDAAIPTDADQEPDEVYEAPPKPEAKTRTDTHGFSAQHVTHGWTHVVLNVFREHREIVSIAIAQ